MMPLQRVDFPAEIESLRNYKSTRSLKRIEFKRGTAAVFPEAAGKKGNAGVPAHALPNVWVSRKGKGCPTLKFGLCFPQCGVVLRDNARLAAEGEIQSQMPWNHHGSGALLFMAHGGAIFCFWRMRKYYAKIWKIWKQLK